MKNLEKISFTNNYKNVKLPSVNIISSFQDVHCAFMDQICQLLPSSNYLTIFQKSNPPAQSFQKFQNILNLSFYQKLFSAFSGSDLGCFVKEFMIIIIREMLLPIWVMRCFIIL